MEPSLRDGDQVLVLRTSANRIRAGEVVIIEEPHLTLAWSSLPAPSRAIEGRRWTVKRVLACAGDPVPPEFGAENGARVPHDAVLVRGDNETVSIDSRHYGPYPADRLLGRLWRPLR